MSRAVLVKKQIKTGVHCKQSTSAPLFKRTIRLCRRRGAIGDGTTVGN